jgi:hypothetical protein
LIKEAVIACYFIRLSPLFLLLLLLLFQLGIVYIKGKGTIQVATLDFKARFSRYDAFAE